MMRKKIQHTVEIKHTVEIYLVIFEGHIILQIDFPNKLLWKDNRALFFNAAFKKWLNIIVNQNLQINAMISKIYCAT